MNIQTQNKAIKRGKIFDLAKPQNQKLFAKWILVEDKLTCIWCNDK